MVVVFVSVIRHASRGTGARRSDVGAVGSVGGRYSHATRYSHAAYFMLNIFILY